MGLEVQFVDRGFDLLEALLRRGVALREILTGLPYLRNKRTQTTSFV